MVPATVLLLGSTGLVGSSALRLLLDSPHVTRVITPVRRAADPIHSKHQPIVGDPFRLSSSDLRCDVVMSALGTTRKKAGSAEAFRRIDYELVLQLFRQARQSGALRAILVSSVGADPHSLFLYPKTKGKLERDLCQLGYEQIDILRPSLLLGHRSESRPVERLALRLSRPIARLCRGSFSKYRPIEAQKVAQAMLGCLERPSQNRVQIFEGDDLFNRAEGGSPAANSN